MSVTKVLTKVTISNAIMHRAHFIWDWKLFINKQGSSEVVQGKRRNTFVLCFQLINFIAALIFLGMLLKGNVIRLKRNILEALKGYNPMFLRTLF